MTDLEQRVAELERMRDEFLADVEHMRLELSAIRTDCPDCQPAPETAMKEEHEKITNRGIERSVGYLCAPVSHATPEQLAQTATVQPDMTDVNSEFTTADVYKMASDINRIADDLDRPQRMALNSASEMLCELAVVLAKQSRQPAPEPVAQALDDLERINYWKDMAIVRHVTPAQVERGRGLVRRFDQERLKIRPPASNNDVAMRDFIAEVCDLKE